MYEDFRKNFIKTIKNEGYSNLLKLFSVINKLTYIWIENNNVEIVNLPITTQSVTSPMGLGSDSKPYKVIFLKVI
nr:hypothetical protein [Mycoplasmopsis synoviae]